MKWTTFWNSFLTFMHLLREIPFAFPHEMFNETTNFAPSKFISKHSDIRRQQKFLLTSSSTDCPRVSLENRGICSYHRRSADTKRPLDTHFAGQVKRSYTTSELFSKN